jgi:hypothetical protein
VKGIPIKKILNSAQIYLSVYSFIKMDKQSIWAEIHQALLSHFSLLAEFLIGKVLVKGKDSRVLKLVNLSPVTLHSPHNWSKTSVSMLNFLHLSFLILSSCNTN